MQPRKPTAESTSGKSTPQAVDGVAAIDELIAAGMGTLTIFVRHELAPHQRALLATFGARYVVDPDAPSCAFSGGERGRWEGCSTCRALDRQTAVRSRAAAEYLRRRARDAGNR